MATVDVVAAVRAAVVRHRSHQHTLPWLTIVLPWRPVACAVQRAGSTTAMLRHYSGGHDRSTSWRMTLRGMAVLSAHVSLVGPADAAKVTDSSVSDVSQPTV